MRPSTDTSMGSSLKPGGSSPKAAARFLLSAMLMCAGTFALIEAGLLEREARLKIDVLAGQAQGLIDDTTRVEQLSSGAINEIRDTVRDSRKQNQQTAENTAKATETLNADLLSMGVLLDGANRTLQDVGRQAGETLSNIDQSVQSTNPAIANLTRASQAAADDLSDPAIKQSLANVQLVTLNTADTTKQLDMTAQDIHAFVHRETTPVRGTWNVIKGFLVSFAGPVAQVITATK
jgi:ABC-type transporter Mla subunit MlaD